MEAHKLPAPEWKEAACELTGKWSDYCERETHVTIRDEVFLDNFIAQALQDAYRKGIEDAAKRCEREAAGIRKHVVTENGVGHVMALACISCATGIRQLPLSET